MFAAMYWPMLVDSDSDDIGSENDDELDLETIYAIEQLTRPGLNEAKNDSDESLLPAVYRLGELLEQRPTANGGLQIPIPGSQRSHQNVSNTSPKKVESLLDLAARCVARTCSCKDLECQLPSLDESVLCKVAYWAFPQDIKQVQAVIAVGETKRGHRENLSHWSKGTALYRNARLKEMWQVGFMLTAYIHKYDNYVTSSDQLEVRVSLTFEKQGIVSGTCSDCKEGIWCPHMVCAAVYRIKHPDKVRVHAPMTETLSTLNRDQLQKMLQYAVQEDPAGILGKLFKYLDNIRDSNSELNSIMGAPDPTFGTLPTEKTTWQLSLEEFEQNFTSELRKYYAGSVTYEISGKLNQPVNRYIRTILDLVQAGDVMSAISALNRITRCAITLLQQSGNGTEYDRFMYELTRLYTQFMLYFGHRDEYRRVLLIHIKSHQISTKLLERHQVNPSNWADLPSIKEVCGYVPEEHLKRGLFIEPLSAQTMVHWPQELNQLLDGEVPVKESSYAEDVRLMLARLECLLTLEESSLAYMKAGRLSARILRVMTKAALADSVLGVNLKLSNDAVSGTASPFASLISSIQPNLAHNSPLPSTSVESRHTPIKKTFLPKRSARKRKVASWCKEHAANPLKKARMSVTISTKSTSTTSTSAPTQRGGKVLPLKEGALGYAMLYCCCNVIMCERSLQEQIEDEDVMTGLCALALEVSRYRWMTRLGPRENEDAENRCLEKLEQLLHSYLVSHPKSAKKAMQLFVQTWNMDGVAFYEGLYPLVLADVVFSPDRTTPSRTYWCSTHDLVHVSSEFILDSADPMARFKPSPGRNNALHDANRYFKSFIVTFFSYLDIDKEDQMNLVLKVLGQFENYSNGKLLNAVKESIMYNTGKFRDQKAIIQKCFSICLAAMLNKDSYTWSAYIRSSCQSDVSYICSLIGKLGVQSLSSLHGGKWDKIFRESDLVTLVDALKLRENPKDLPTPAAQLLREYYKCQSKYHDLETSMTLLGCYNTASEGYREVIDIILENWIRYDPEFLFQIARRENDVFVKESATKKGKKAVSSNKLAPKAVGFVEKAIIKLSDRQELPLGILAHLDWAYAMCMNGSTTGRQKGSLLEKIVKLMETEVKDSPAMLVSILSFAMKEKSIQEQVKPLYTCLFTAYRNHFVRAVGSPGTYKSVISGLADALEKCGNCVPDGKSRFHQEVLRMLRVLHAGKKKLLRMLDENFGSAE